MKDALNKATAVALCAVWMGLPFLLFMAWITHIFDTISDGEWLLLIAGAIAFPVGIIHGIGIWFGIW